jgi:DNA-binding transcriptional regulator YdaS (Cro superfamily)
MNEARPHPMKLSEAMTHFKVTTRSALARELGISRQAVSQWGEVVPELMQYRIEARLRARAQSPESPA